MAYRNSVEERSVTFAASATSPEIDLGGGTLVGLVVPASSGISSFTITDSLASGGTFSTVSDYTGVAITITVSSSAAGVYNIPPSSVAVCGRYIKLVANASNSQTIGVRIRDIA